MEGHVGFSLGKEKASPASRPAHPDPQAPDSESIIVAMERVSVLFDRYASRRARPQIALTPVRSSLLLTRRLFLSLQDQEGFSQ